jgi:TonB-dependent receptor
MKQSLSKTIKTALLASAAGAVVSFAMTSTAIAQTSDADTAGSNEEIVVTGIRATLENALQNKRKADVILDGISADDLGNFPDLNLGEALQRITGVQIDRSGDRRSATISVRGLPGAFTQTTVMGQNIASPRGGGSNRAGNPFGVYDSAIFSGADVEKSFTAESLSGGLAANVNLKLNSALERRDGAGVVRALADYEESTEKFNPGVYGTYSKHFNEGKVGVFGTVAYRKENFRRDSLNITDYRNDAESLTELFDNGATRSDIYVGDIRRFTNKIEGERLSAAGGFEFAATDNFNFRLDGIYAQRDLKDATQDIVQVQPRQSRPQVTSPDDGEFIGRFDFNRDGTDEDVFLHQVITSEDPQVAFGNRSFPSLERTWALYPQMTWENEDLKLNVIGTYSKARNRVTLDQFDTRINQTGRNTETRPGIRDRTNGVVATINSGGANVEDFSISLDIPDTALDLSGGNFAFTNPSGIQVQRDNNGVRNVFTIAGFAQGVDRELKAIDGDLEYKFSKGPFVGVKVGGRYEEETASSFRFNNSLFGANVNNLDNSILVPGTAASSGASFFGGLVDGSGGDEFLSLDLDRVRELILPLATSGNGENVPSDIIVPTRIRGTTLDRLRPIPLINNPLTDFNQSVNQFINGNFGPQSNVVANTFTAERNNLELFGMVNYDFSENYTTFPVRGNFGLRYIETDLSGLALGEEQEGTGSYKEWLPSANLIANLREDVIMNFAYYRTFEAFNLAEFRPLPSTVDVREPDDSIDDEEERSGSIRITESTLTLEPRSSEAFDLGFAYYNRPGSIIGVNFFTKEVVQIERISTGGLNNEFCEQPIDAVAANNPDAAAALGNGTPFIDSRGQCRLDIGRVDDENPSLSINRFRNSDPIRVNGVEFQVTQNTDFLDGFWGNFGGTFNYSYVDSGSGSGSNLTGVSKHSYNLIGFYEEDKFSIRLAQNFRSRADLESGGTFFGRERQTKARTQYDLSLTYNPRKSTQFRLQGFNLTNVIREEFEGLEILPRRRDFDGRTITLSVQQRF